MYLDDVLLFATSFQEFIDLLEEALRLLPRSGFKVSVTKCRFSVLSLTLLGYAISKEGKQPNSVKLEAILKMTTPTTVKSIVLATDSKRLVTYHPRGLPDFGGSPDYCQD